ncbi:MAG: pyrroline-5-carboxylate reductase [Desulfobulbaceae bacterium]|jgi:pyrroline-5-carboxylate reductase|nr:pyrroline-5-carboxylate reductase [Desulfobulbaceae bacterium]MDY0351785.1 pyrroline-5-carboxylate reductase [Desulfobulbaceae bacterium]
MHNFYTIGLVGGGQMGEALIRGMIHSGLTAAGNIMVVEPDTERAAHLEREYGVRLLADAAALAASCPVLILAVKPQIMDKVLGAYRKHLTGDHLVISIAAGIPIRTLEKGLGSDKRIVRVMPNTPALVLAGASALSPNSRATAADMATVRRIFSAVGMCVEVSEPLLDAVTGLSGSGPGYVFMFIEALIDGGVLAGLPRDTAEKLVLQTVYGAAKLAIESGEPAAVLKGRVTSPGGTTITGLQVLEESGFRGAIMTAVEAAADKSRELGQ